MAETTTTKQLPIIEKVKEAIKAFEETQIKYKSFGAYDTEPDGVWQRLLLKTIEGSGPTPPRDADRWELYSTSMDCTEAAQALFDAALHAIQTIEGCPIRDLGALKHYLKEYCWRFN